MDSAAVDTLCAQPGVRALVQLRDQRPTDPWPLVWLAEALARGGTERPGAREAIVRCEQAAWALALAALLDDPGALANTHVLARIYLSRGVPAPAAPLAEVSAVTGEADLALVTLAFALLRNGDEERARIAAEHAIEQGCSVGHQVLADLAMARRAHVEVVEHLTQIEEADRVRYYGVDPADETRARLDRAA